MIRKIFALLKKDFLNEASYKLSFILTVFGVVASLLVYFFIDKLFGSTMASHLKEFRVNYFPYVLLSMAFFSYIGVGIGSFSSRIRYEQMEGTLESLLLSPTKIYTILFSMCLWNLIFASFDVMIYILAGIFVFKINFSNINLLSTMVVLILTIASFSCLGIISASFVVVFKRGNPIDWLFNTLEGILGGVYFPASVLPGFLQIIAKLLPITYAIRAIQLAVWRGYSLAQLKSEIGLLLLFSLVLVPLSLYIFMAALKKARRQGSLAQY